MFAFANDVCCQVVLQTVVMLQLPSSVESVPCPLGHVQLRSLLSRIKGPINVLKCGHYVYPSQITFVHHILWLIYSDSSANGDPNVVSEHWRLLYPAVAARMCINCINMILCSVHFSDILTLHYSGESSIAHRRNLLCNILRHPKSHRMFARSFGVKRKHFIMSMSFVQEERNRYLIRHRFYAQCLVLLDSVQSESFVHRQKMIFIRTLCLSVRHWSRYQLLFFVNHLFWELNRTLLEYSSRLKIDPVEAFGWRCHELVCWRAARLGLKYGANYLRQRIRDKDTYSEIYSRARATRVKKKRGVTEYHMVCLIKCGRSGCSTEKGHVGKGEMKVCSQCRMTYYCSRKCQKHDWKERHRLRCPVMYENYSNIL